MNTISDKKLRTGIEGLDELFYGGINIHENENGQRGLIMLARGQHGVNKIHLAMQICEGLYNSSHDDETSNLGKNGVQEVLFISINKDSQMLKNSYYDFYIQRLIKKIREAPREESESESEKALRLLYSMTWESDNQSNNLRTLLEEYKFPSISNKADTKARQQFEKDIRTGFIYYNGRTHGLHVRHQKGATDSGDLLLCRAIIPNDYNVSIIGKDFLNVDGGDVDGVTTFQKMMRQLDTLDKNNNKPKFIMIDGLSRLNEAELAQCPLNALADRLRHMATVAIITADEKLKPSEISTDIIIDMDIRQRESSDHQYSALKISKCLYQKNAYGWHLYKMRNAGIEVIPSIYLQMGQRFLMDDIVTDAILPINKFPYPYWLNENETIFKDKKDNDKDYDLVKARSTHKDSSGSDGLREQGVLKGALLDKKSMSDYFMNIIDVSKEKNENHYLFVSFDRNRTCFYNDFIKDKDEYSSIPDNIHFFHFRPGYYHPDEILWTLNRQIKAIAKKGATDSVLSTHYTHVSLVLGDLNYIHYAYPGLSDDSLLLPALATYTKKHHMKNYVYATVNPIGNLLGANNSDLYKKEIETVLQIQRIANEFEDLRTKK